MTKPLDIKGIRFGGGRPVICVPVVETERSAILCKIRSLVRKRVQMIEWRADCFDGISEPDQVRGILDEIRPLVDDTVMLFTIRTKNQGGNADLSEKRILYLDETAAKSGSIDLIDLEYFELSRPEREILRLRQMGVRVIASHHDFSATPQDAVLCMVMDQLAHSGADIAKLAVMPHTADDVIRLFRLTNDTGQNYPDLPLITIAMGDRGVLSRLAGETFGSCVTFGADGETSAPGQLQADALSGILDVIHESMDHGTPHPGVEEDRGDHVFLIGFMGTGKTTVSHSLSGLLDLGEVDLDETVERECGLTVADLFEQNGEEYFREKETAMLQKMAEGPAAVISCGGGCVLRRENVSVMKKSGKIVLLTASPETVYERVKDGTDRPILNGHMNVDYIADLMEQRLPAYAAACDICIPTDKKTPPQIAEEIRAALR